MKTAESRTCHSVAIHSSLLLVVLLALFFALPAAAADTSTPNLCDSLNISTLNLSKEEIAGKLAILEKALMTQSNHLVKEALMKVVPTYKSPEEVNEQAIQAEEMRQAAGA